MQGLEADLVDQVGVAPSRSEVAARSHDEALGSVVTPTTMCPIRLPGEVMGAASVAVVPKSDSRLRPIPY